MLWLKSIFLCVTLSNAKFSKISIKIIEMRFILIVPSFRIAICKQKALSPRKCRSTLFADLWAGGGGIMLSEYFKTLFPINTFKIYFNTVQLIQILPSLFLNTHTYIYIGSTSKMKESFIFPSNKEDHSATFIFH